MKIHLSLADLVQKAINAGDDEVLMVIAQRLPDLAAVVGSDGDGASSLIVRSIRALFTSNLNYNRLLNLLFSISPVQPILSDILIFVEEIVVAQAAADAFCAIIPLFTIDQVDKKALPLIRKLHEG